MGDYRSLTFCCKPGYCLTNSYKCKRDKLLLELGLSSEIFIKIKEKFSKENDWDSDIVCFGSISYCCMRRDGCPRRDLALKKRYPVMTREEILEVYFQKKKELSKIILENVDQPEGKKKAQIYLELF